jgi:predicted transport protein
MEKGLIEKTGKSLYHWIKVVRDSQLEKHGEIIKFLKAEHGFTHGFANFVSLKSRGTDAASKNDDELINQQYSKGKEHLKPIYELLISKVRELGDDIQIIPKNSNVSVRRKRQFLLIQPSTKTRMDLGLKLNNSEPGNRLLNSGNFGSMCSNRMVIENKEAIDDVVLGYIRQAYIDAG